MVAGPRTYPGTGLPGFAAAASTLAVNYSGAHPSRVPRSFLDGGLLPSPRAAICPFDCASGSHRASVFLPASYCLSDLCSGLPPAHVSLSFQQGKGWRVEFSLQQRPGLIVPSGSLLRSSTAIPSWRYRLGLSERCLLLGLLHAQGPQGLISWWHRRSCQDV